MQNLLRLRLFEEKQERGEDLDEPERPVGIRAPRHVLRPLHRLRTPCEVEKLMMQIVAENEHGEEEVDAEDCLEPRRHCAFKHVLIRCPCDPEQCHRETAAKHIVEIPEEALECCVVCERENLCHAVELPEQEHGDEEKDGAPRSVVEHALSERHPPDNRHNEGEDEDDEPLMRLRRREEGALTDLRVVACVCCTQGEEKIGRHRTRGEDICGRRVACSRQCIGQYVGKCERYAREQPLCERERPIRRGDNRETCAAPNEAVCLVVKDHIDVAHISVGEDAPHTAMDGIKAEPSLLLHPCEPMKRRVEIGTHPLGEQQKEDLACG